MIKSQNKFIIKIVDKNLKIKKGLELLLSTDAYKIEHANQYPEDTNLVYSYVSARKSFISYVKKVYCFGIREMLLLIVNKWDNDFFSLTESEVDILLDEFKIIVDKIFINRKFDISRFKKLWKQKSLLNIIKIKYIKNDEIVDFQTPLIKIWNSKKNFYWLPGYLETSIISNIWPIITNATKAYYLKGLLNKFAAETADNNEFVDFQAHDFSYRGLPISSGAKYIGLSHIHFFKGSDTLPAILKYNELFKNDIWRGNSVIATEHSIMSSYGKENEFELFKNLIKKYSDGIFSVVSDTYNYSRVLNEYIPKLKTEILSIKGKLVIRPDSGNPVKISRETINKLWDVFGGHINTKGYKVINPKIGLIYGDGFNYDVVKKILFELKKNNFSSKNIVFGMGGKMYNESNRDSLSFAMKASYIEISGDSKNINKEVVGDKSKKSFKGLLSYKNNITKSEVSWSESENDDLIFLLS